MQSLTVQHDFLSHKNLLLATCWWKWNSYLNWL